MNKNLSDEQKHIISQWFLRHSAMQIVPKSTIKYLNSILYNFKLESDWHKLNEIYLKRSK